MEKKKIDARDFLILLDSNVNVSDLIVEGEININLLTNNKDYFFNQIIFKDDVSFSNIENCNNSKLFFFQCDFKSDLYFENVSLHSTSFKKCSFYYFDIVNSNFEKIKLIGNNVEVENLNELWISESIINLLELNIIRSKSLCFHGTYNSLYSNNIITENMIFKQGYVKNIELKSIQPKHFLFDSFKVDKSRISINKSSVINLINVDSNEFNFNLDLTNKFDFLVSYSKFKFFFCNIFGLFGESNFRFLKNEILNKSSVNFSSSEPHLYLAEIDCDEKSLGSMDFDFYRMEIVKLSITGKLSSGSLNIEGIIFKQLDFTSFINDAYFSLARFTNMWYADPTFRIHDSNLGNTFLNRGNLDSCKIDYRGSSISKITYNEMIWFKNYIVYDQIKLHSRNIVEFFRQMKVVAINNNDKIKEIEFKAYEFDSYFTIIGGGNLSLEDRLSFWLSKNTNYFGLVWTIPLIQFILINYFIYLFLGFHGEYRGNSIFICHSLDIQVFFDLFNPAHKTIFSSSDWFTKLIEFLSRLISSFYIFQIVKAFRKYF